MSGLLFSTRPAPANRSCAAALKCFVVFLTFRNFLMNLCGAIFGDFELPESPARITLACLSAEPIALSDAFTSFA